MNYNVPYFISYPILSVIIGLTVLSIPLLATFVLIPILPLALLLDFAIPGNFMATGSDVNFGFAWIELKSFGAWLFFGGIYLMFGFVVGLIKEASIGNTNLSPRRSAFFYSFFVLFLIPLLLIAIIELSIGECGIDCFMY